MAPSAKDNNYAVVDAGKPDAQRSADHLGKSAHEIKLAAYDAGDAVYKSGNEAYQATSEWSQGVAQNTKQAANEAAKRTQELTNSAIEKTKKTAQDVGDRSREQYQQAKKLSGDILDRAISPETRERYRHQVDDFAKHSPLAFSFIAMQGIALAIPLTIFAILSLSTLFVAVSSAIVSSLVVISGFALFWFPIIGSISVVTTFVWACLVGTFLAFNWFYYHVYSKSALQSNVQEFGRRVEQINHQIEANAEDEVKGYSREIRGGFYQGRDQLIDGAEKIKNDPKGAYADGKAKVADGKNKIKDEVKNGIHDGAEKVENGARNVKNETKKY